MTHHFEQEIHELKATLLTMASHAEGAVMHALNAVVERDDDRARQVQEEDSVIDRLEIEVDEKYKKILIDLSK